jgi:hypothetical protein
MHTIKINISDTLYTDVIAFLHKLPQSELTIEEVEQPFLVNSIAEAKSRIAKAEANSSYMTHDEVNKSIDSFIKSL